MKRQIRLGVARRPSGTSPVPPSSEWLSLAGGQTWVRWRRSGQARRISLRIDARAGGVVVTLPTRVARDAGLDLLKAHSHWVAEKLAALPGLVTFEAGGRVAINGISHEIRAVPDARRGVWIEAGEIRVSGELDFLARRVEDFLRRQARVQLGAQLQEIATSSGLQPRRLVIKDTSSRWGSCSSDGVVMLSWRLVMAPETVQHYVVAHELAHLRHLDHSQDFWALVQTLTPHRKVAEGWLRTHGPALLRTG